MNILFYFSIVLSVLIISGCSDTTKELGNTSKKAKIDGNKYAD